MAVAGRKHVVARLPPDRRTGPPYVCQRLRAPASANMRSCMCARCEGVASNRRPQNCAHRILHTCLLWNAIPILGRHSRRKHAPTQTYKPLPEIGVGWLQTILLHGLWCSGVGIRLYQEHSWLQTGFTATDECFVTKQQNILIELYTNKNWESMRKRSLKTASQFYVYSTIFFSIFRSKTHTFSIIHIIKIYTN